MDVLNKNCDRSNRLLREAFAWMLTCMLLLSSTACEQKSNQSGSPKPTAEKPVDSTPSPAPSATPVPVKSGGKRAEYAKDVVIDWNTKQVEVSAKVVQTDLPIELLLCAENTKEHESILVTGAQPKKIFEALGMIGATVGTPAAIDPATGKQTAATGQPLDIDIEYEADGKKFRQKAHEWMVDSKNKKPIGPLNWVFCGSRTEDGKFTADADGTIACVVDFSTALIGLAESHSASDAELWVLADKNRVPKVGTKCTVTIRPKQDSSPSPSKTTAVAKTDPAHSDSAAGDTEPIDLQLTPEGFFQYNDDILDALSLDALIKDRIKSNPAQKVSLTAMQVEPDAVEKMNLFTRLAGRAIIGSGIDQKNLTMTLLDEPPKSESKVEPSDASDAGDETTAKSDPAATSPTPAPENLGEIRRESAEKKKQSNATPTPEPSPEPKNP